MTDQTSASIRSARASWVVGVDLGGTNVRLALYRELLEARAERTRLEGAATAPEAVLAHREEVGDERGAAQVAVRLAQGIEQLLADAGVADQRVPVGVGIAAMLRGFDGDVANAPNLAWRNEPFGRMLGDALGPGRPVGLYNDVNAITYGEYAFGAGMGATDVLAVFMGTGIGGGLVTEGNLVEGASNCAGEIGHVKVDLRPDAPLCGCGGHGCLEALAGGRNLQERLRTDAAAGRLSGILRLAGSVDTVTPGHLDLAAAESDAGALALYDDLVPRIASSLANAVFVLNPSRLILGGGMLMRMPVLRRRIIEDVPRYLTAAQIEPLAIVETRLGEDAGLLGSALRAAERLGAS
jgi:glucokinase